MAETNLVEAVQSTDAVETVQVIDRAVDLLSQVEWIPEAMWRPLSIGLVTLGILIVSFLIYAILHNYLQRLINRLVEKTTNQWDDALMEEGVFRRILRLFPLLFLYLGIDWVIRPSGGGVLISRIVFAGLILSVGRVLQGVFDSADRIYRMGAKTDKRSIKGYLQAAMIVVYVFVTIFVIATLFGKSPWGLFSVLGGLTAVILLIFKDTILGFVAGVQLAEHDMVRIGDWIEMPKYGADGDVIDVSLNTVKVQNWDKTISTIPPYALVSDSFKNWRGMSDAAGRRIKRSIGIDMNSIRFVDEKLIERFRQIVCLSGYLDEKQKEIDTDNEQRGIDLSMKVNGRRQTNIGIFRAYLQQYLRSHPMVHDEMTFLVRQLQPTAEGLPIEIYVFSRDKVWANYEAIQADIFDHVLAALPEFELRVFQSPSGADFRTLQAG